MTEGGTPWVQIKGEDVKVGDTVRVVEKYEHVTATYEGRVFRRNERLATLGGPGAHLSAWIAPESGVEVTVYRQPPALPTAVGTVVKFYDAQYLEDVVVHRMTQGWYGVSPERRFGSYYRAERVLAGQPEVLFDPTAS